MYAFWPIRCQHGASKWRLQCKFCHVEKFYCFIKLLIKCTYIDGIDGKQARRTGTSGPLGELFDHGLDSYTAGLIPAAMYSIFGRGARYSVPPFRMFFTLCNVLNNFYLTHFEKYNTGVMFLPWGYDFTMCGMIVVFLITGVSFVPFFEWFCTGCTVGRLKFMAVQPTRRYY